MLIRIRHWGEARSLCQTRLRITATSVMPSDARLGTSTPAPEARASIATQWNGLATKRGTIRSSFPIDTQRRPDRFRSSGYPRQLDAFGPNGSEAERWCRTRCSRSHRDGRRDIPPIGARGSRHGGAAPSRHKPSRGPGVDRFELRMALDEAPANGWTVVDLEYDRKAVFPCPGAESTAVQDPRAGGTPSTSGIFSSDVPRAHPRRSLARGFRAPSAPSELYEFVADRVAHECGRGVHIDLAHRRGPVAFDRL